MIAIGWWVAAATAEEVPCSTEPPHGYVVAVGWAEGKRARALQEAQDMARNRLMAQLCDARSPARCDALRPHVRDWEPSYDEGSRTACALAIVAKDQVEALGADVDRYQQSLAALAEAVAAGARGPVFFPEPSPEGQASQLLRHGLQAALADTEVVFASSSGAEELAMELALAGDQISVGAQLGAGSTWRPLPGFSVPMDVLGVESLGVVDDAAAPLSLELSAALSDGTLLRSGSVVHSGDTFKLFAEVSQEAFLYVVYENSAGEEALVQPAGKFVRPGETAELPKEGFSFTVDQHVGRTEVVYVLATPDQLSEGVTASMARDYRRTRGLGVTADDGSDSARWQGDPVTIARGYGGVVVKLSLDHQ